MTAVPEVVPPLLPIAKVYSIVPDVSTAEVPVLERVKFAGVALTVVDALAQLELVQLTPGAGGVVEPVSPTDA